MKVNKEGHYSDKLLRTETKLLRQYKSYARRGLIIWKKNLFHTQIAGYRPGRRDTVSSPSDVADWEWIILPYLLGKEIIRNPLSMYPSMM